MKNQTSDADLPLQVIIPEMIFTVDNSCLK